MAGHPGGLEQSEDVGLLYTKAAFPTASCVSKKSFSPLFWDEKERKRRYFVSFAFVLRSFCSPPESPHRTKSLTNRRDARVNLARLLSSPEPSVAPAYLHSNLPRRE